MSRTEVDLANAALGYLVRGTLRNLDGQDIQTIEIKSKMDLAKELVIEEYDWPESRVIAPLVVAAVTAPGWEYAYVAPADLVKVWLLGEERATKTTPFALGMVADVSNDTQYFFTDLTPAYLRYGSSRTSIARFSAGVFDLIAQRLAILTCMNLTKDAKMLQFLKNNYDKELSKVKTRVANSEPEVIDIDFTPETISVRSQ